MSKSKPSKSSDPIKATIGKKAKTVVEAAKKPVAAPAKPAAPVKPAAPAKAPSKPAFAKPPAAPAVKVEVKVETKPAKAAKAPKPVIKATVAPTPPPKAKAGSVAASLSKLRKVADQAIVGSKGTEVEPEQTQVPVVKEADNLHPEAMVRKPPVVPKKVVAPVAGKLSFEGLLAANREAQNQAAPAPLFDVTKYLKK